MSLFGKVVRTVVNTAVLPVAVVKDVFTLGGIATNNGTPYTAEQLQKIKDEAED
ncbi:MAG: hypothetical protein WCA44_17945 [Acidobacteriaceae bacterium]